MSLIANLSLSLSFYLYIVLYISLRRSQRLRAETSRAAAAKPYLSRIGAGYDVCQRLMIDWSGFHVY